MDLAIRRSPIILLGTISGVKKLKLDCNSIRNKVIEGRDNILKNLGLNKTKRTGSREDMFLFLENGTLFIN